MTFNAPALAVQAAADRFWQNIDQRTEVAPGVSESHTDTPLFAWGILGTPLALPLPHFRLFIPSPYYVIGWALIADAPGNVVVKVEHATYSGSSSVRFSSVTGGADPTLAGQQAVLTTRLSTWSPNKWGMFDLLHIYIDSTDSLQELTFQLFTRRVRRVGLQGVMTDSSGNTMTATDGTPFVLSHP